MGSFVFVMYRFSLRAKHILCQNHSQAHESGNSLLRRCWRLSSGQDVELRPCCSHEQHVGCSASWYASRYEVDEFAPHPL